MMSFSCNFFSFPSSGKIAYIILSDDILTVIRVHRSFSVKATISEEDAAKTAAANADAGAPTMYDLLSI